MAAPRGGPVVVEPSSLPDTEVVVAFSLPEREKRKLLARAQANGTDLPTYLRTLVEEDLKRTSTLREILAPIHEDFRRSGMTEEELEAFLEGELAAARKERRDMNPAE